MPPDSHRTDYFDNIGDADNRRAAISGYLAKELILRAATPSRAADLLKWHGWISRFVGNAAIATLASWLSRRVLENGTRSIEELPIRYLILHEDIFFIPRGLKVVRKLAPGHFVLQGAQSQIGIIACRRGSIESAILADCLGRAGVRHIVYVGTCLRIGSSAAHALVPTSLLGDSAFLRAPYGEPALSDAFSLALEEALIAGRLTLGRGPVFEAHGFLRDEGPAQMRSLHQQSCVAIEMELAGLAAGLSRFGGHLCAALVPLDSFEAPIGLVEPLNTNVGVYLRLMGPIQRVIEQAALFLESYGPTHDGS